MNWPTAHDYQEAATNPNICFYAPELRLGQSNSGFGTLPQNVLSNTSVVIKINTGNQSLAVKCFLKPITEEQQHYQTLKQQLLFSSSQHLIDFDYLSQGILIKDQWYPVIKMNWVEGISLSRFIEENVNSPEKLLEISAKWRNLISNLQNSYIAHGDLEHNNILVTPQRYLCLIDYDTMFVGAFRGKKSPHLGNENFQHPKRTVEDYNEKIDNFPALVIYLTLRALAYQPNLWQQFYQGENLLFTKKDYLMPQQSSLFYQLKQSPDQVVRELTTILENVCVSPLTATQNLELILSKFPNASLLESPSSVTPQTRVAPINSTPNQPMQLPNWQGIPTNPTPQQPIPNALPQNISNNAFNPVPLQQAPPVIKTQSPLWLKLFAVASSFATFFFICLSIYLLFSYEKKVSNLQADVTYYNDLLTAEREKTAKLEEELAQEKTKSLNKNKNLSDFTSKILSEAILGTQKIDKFDAKVDSIKFFEGGNDGTPRELRAYLNTFTRASRYIFWELNLAHPSRANKETFTIDQVWYKDGQEWVRQSYNTYLDPTWVTSYHNDGRGWATSYNWTAGNYKVDLYVDGKKITSGSFTIAP